MTSGANSALTDPCVPGPPGHPLMSHTHMSKVGSVLSTKPFPPRVSSSEMAHHSGPGTWAVLGPSPSLPTPDTPDHLKHPLSSHLPPQIHCPCPGPSHSFPTQAMLQLPPWSLASRSVLSSPPLTHSRGICGSTNWYCPHLALNPPTAPLWDKVQAPHWVLKDSCSLTLRISPVPSLLTLPS